MDKPYSHERKQKLADKIASIKKKKDLVKVFEIINEENPQVTENKTENNNGLFMFFHKLENRTYYKIEKYLDKVNKERHYYSDSVNSANSDTCSEKREYVPYMKDEFPEQTGISPKLKFSNKEKNWIKRRRYDHTINSENVNEDVVYCQFDVTISDQDKSSD